MISLKRRMGLLQDKAAIFRGARLGGFRYDIDAGIQETSRLLLKQVGLRWLSCLLHSRHGPERRRHTTSMSELTVLPCSPRLRLSQSPII